MSKNRLQWAVGAADVCELLSCAFAFPDERLAQGLCNGTLIDDAEACLGDVGVDEHSARVVSEDLRAWVGSNAYELRAHMRKTYSCLYLAPGGHTPIFPYESAFLHVERGLAGTPSLFRSPVTLDVERHMYESGVVAKNGRKEPCDSVFEEFEFLSYLFAMQAEALRTGDDGNAVLRGSQAQRFLKEHALVWLPSFMDRTVELADGSYVALAQFAGVVLPKLLNEG